MRKADWIIGLLIAALVLVGISYFVRTYKTIQKQNPDRPSVEETLNKMGDGETATLDEEDEYEEDEFPDDRDTSTYEPELPSASDLANLNDAREGAGIGGGTTGAEGDAGSSSTPTSYSSSANRGKYLVVAGTFKQEINAQTQLKKFKKMGYKDAEIGKFNKNSYASLIVERFASSADAKKLVKSLKNKGIDAYVHTKR